MRRPQPRHAAGHTGGEMPGDRAVAGLAFRVEIHVAAGGRGRRLAEVERVALAADVRDHEAAAADVAGTRQHGRQGERRGHGRVHRVAAVAQHGESRFGGERLVADHHALHALGRRPIEREGPALWHLRRRRRTSGQSGLRGRRCGRRVGLAAAERHEGNGEDDRQVAGHGREDTPQRRPARNNRRPQRSGSEERQRQGFGMRSVALIIALPLAP